MLYIYILQLESGKYYIGKTTNPDFRLESHFDSTGSAWTLKYKPLQLLELFVGDDFDEDKYTLKYMSKYGIPNVRGGSFCQITLSEENLRTIKWMIEFKNYSEKNTNNENLVSNEYITKFSNIDDTNNEIMKLEKQFEYIDLLNKILHNLNYNYTICINNLNYLEENLKKLNSNDKNHKINIKNLLNQHSNKVFSRFFRINNKSMQSNEIIVNFTNTDTIDFDVKLNIDDLCQTLFFIIGNIKENEEIDKKYEKMFHILTNIDTNVLKFFFNDFFDYKKQILGYLEIMQTKFGDYIHNKYFNFNINYSLEKLNFNVKINQFRLFLLQIKNEIKRIYSLHQVNTNCEFELVINKKINMLTEKMIIMMEKIDL